MKSNNIMLRANRLNERIVRIKDATVIISANMKKAGVVGRALVIHEHLGIVGQDEPLHDEIQFVGVVSEEKTKLTVDGPTMPHAEQQRQLLDAIHGFCDDFQSVGNRSDCPCDYWLVPGNTEICFTLVTESL